MLDVEGEGGGAHGLAGEPTDALEGEDGVQAAGLALVLFFFFFFCGLAGDLGTGRLVPVGWNKRWTHHEPFAGEVTNGLGRRGSHGIVKVNYLVVAGWV